VPITVIYVRYSFSLSASFSEVSSDINCAMAICASIVDECDCRKHPTTTTHWNMHINHNRWVSLFCSSISCSPS